MSQRRRWTNEEEQVLINQVRQNPGNLARAFRATSDVIGRSSHLIEQITLVIMKEVKIVNCILF